MAYLDQAALATDDTFRSRVRVAVMTAARDVMGEAVGSYSDTQYGKRQALASEALRSAAGGPLLEAFVWGTAANPVITDESPDDAIQFTVNSIVDDLSGVRATD